jgi:Lon protease-like protein
MNLALFPLNLVVYPNESLNLHIFESRYRQLVRDAIENKSTFGIPVFMQGSIQEYGTEVKIVELTNQYDDGRMDIKTKGLRIFRLKSFINPIPDKLHAGGEVEWVKIDDEVDALEKIWFIEALVELYEVLHVQVPIKEDIQYLSYEYAHKAGLSQKQEYELLTIESEGDRLRYLTEHIKKSIPTIQEMERTKSIIKMNGQFKNLDPIKL